MNFVRTICVKSNQHLCRSFARNLRFSAVNLESSQASQPLVQEEKFDFEDINVLERTERRKEKIPPFMKDVFISVFNRDLLAFPEVLNKEESEALDSRIERLQRVFEDPERTAEDRKNVLKMAKMYAAPVALTNNGLAMNITESLRYLEVISSDLQLAQKISDHWVALEAVKKGLDKTQYDQLIDTLTSGDSTIALCIKEKIAERLTQADFRTNAEMDRNGRWRITGEKVYSQQHNGHFLVLSTGEAKTFKLFLVNPNADGITQDGLTVSFRKTPAIPLELGAEQEMSRTLGLSRLHMAVLARCALLKVLNSVAGFVHKKAFSGQPLSDLSIIKKSFGSVLLHIYAAESAQYFTAGVLDSYVDPDAELETAMCRNYMALHTLPSAVELLSISAPEQPAEADRLMDEARTLVLRGETLFSVNMFIAMNGIHHAGKHMAEEVKQIRNPLFNPGFILKKVFHDRHQEKDAPKLTLRLCEHLHPSLRQPADELEYCVLRMKYACETLMSRYGVDIAQAYTELDRLAQASTEILAMTAVLARASRSYCIGVRNAEVEMKLAACFVTQTKERVRKLILEIDDGEYLNLDHFRVQFGKKLLETKAMIVEKPTTRVFW